MMVKVSPKCVAAAICMCVLSALAGARGQSANECFPNGGFQDRIDDKGNAAPWWASGNMSFETDESGNRVMKFTGGYKLEWEAPGKAIANAQYVLKFRAKTEDALNVRMCLWTRLPDQHEPPNKPIFTKPIKGTTDWRDYEVTFRMPEGITRYIIFIDNMTSGAKLWLDDLSIRPLKDAPLELPDDQPSFGTVDREQLCWVWSEPGFNWKSRKMNNDVGVPVPEKTVRFRRNIEIPANFRDACAIFTGDDQATLVVNGKEIATNAATQDIAKAPLNDVLKAGSNTVEFAVINRAGPAGLLARVEYEDSAGHRQFAMSNEKWECSEDGGKTWRAASIAALPVPAPVNYAWVFPHLSPKVSSPAMTINVPEDVDAVRMAMRASNGARMQIGGKDALVVLSAGQVIKQDITEKLKDGRQIGFIFEDICQPALGQVTVEYIRGDQTQTLTLLDASLPDGSHPAPVHAAYPAKSWPINVGAFEAASTRDVPNLNGRLEPWAESLLEGSTKLWQIGKDDNTSAEFAPIKAGRDAVNVTEAAKNVPCGLAQGIRAEAVLSFNLASVPVNGTAFVMDVEDADAMVGSVGVFVNGILCGMPQVIGYDQVPGGRLTNRAWVVTIPPERLKAGANTLALKLLPGYYEDKGGADNQSEEYIRGLNLRNRGENPYKTALWLRWDTLYMSALAKPATDPVNGRPVWMGTTMAYLILNGAKPFQDYVLRDLSYLGLEQAGAPIRYGVSLLSHFNKLIAHEEGLPDGQSVGEYQLSAMKQMGMRPYLIFDSGKNIGNPSEIAGSFEMKVINTFGKYFDFVEVGNEVDNPYYGWDSLSMALAYGNIQRQSVCGQLYQKQAEHPFKLVSEGWYHAWDFSVIDAQNRKETPDDPGYTDLISAHSYGKSYIIPAVTYYLLYGVNYPKPLWVSECGSYTKDDEQIYDFELNMRGNLAYATYIVQYLSHPYSNDMRRFSMFSAQKKDAEVLEKARCYRRLVHAYAMHGRPLPWRYANDADMQNKLVMVNPVETDKAYKISMVNFSKQRQSVDVTVTMPGSVDAQAIRYGEGKTVEEGTKNVHIQALPELKLSETLAPGETVEYLIRK